MSTETFTCALYLERNQIEVTGAGQNRIKNTTHVDTFAGFGFGSKQLKLHSPWT